MNEKLIDAVAVLMNKADEIVDAEGYEIEESIEDPDEFLEALAQLVESEDLSESALEQLVQIGDAMHAALDIELTEASWTKFVNKAKKKIDWAQKQPGGEAGARQRRRTDASDVLAQRAAEISAHEPLMTRGKSVIGGETGKAAAEKRQQRALELLKKRKPASVTSIKPAKTAEAPQKKAANEELDTETEAVLVAMAEALDQAGYDVPEELTICQFIEQVEELLGSEGALEEDVSTSLADALEAVRGQCGCEESKTSALMIGKGDNQRQVGPLGRKLYKQQAARKLRRAAKLDPEGAPQRQGRSGYGS